MQGIDYDFETITACADALRPKVQNRAIIGFALPSGMQPDAVGLSVADDSWYPFAGVRLMQHQIHLMLPAGGYGPGSEKRVYAIRVLKALGSETLIIGENCVALHPRMPKGSLVAVADHINMTGKNPLVGPNDERVGPRFSDMSAPYDLKYMNQLEHLTQKRGLIIQRGVYAAVAGPPTMAECQLLVQVGADVFGFGVAHDTIAAVHTGLRVMAIARVTSRCISEGPMDEQENTYTTSLDADTIDLILRSAEYV